MRNEGGVGRDFMFFHSDWLGHWNIELCKLSIENFDLIFHSIFVKNTFCINIINTGRKLIIITSHAIGESEFSGNVINFDKNIIHR